MTSSLVNAYNQQRSCADTRSLCHAPSYGMHLSSNGLVTACSLTRFDPLGKYPEESLEQIWWGGRARAARRAMLGDVFPPGCNICSSDARAGQYRQMRAHAYDVYARTPTLKLIEQLRNVTTNGKFGEYPRQMSFELANTCNLECVMCLGLLSSSIRKNREKLPPLARHYGSELLPQLKPFIPHLQEASFYGGEPFLIDLYLDIWELFAELNPRCKIFITTNATVLTNRIRALLQRLPNVQLVVSLDGITAPTFEGIRINAKLSRVLENVQYFKTVCQRHGRRLVVSPTYMRANWAEYPKLLDFANREDLVFQTNVLLTPTELSLAYASSELLEEVYQCWRNHSAASAVSPEQGALNRQAFDGATAQIALWLQEAKEFESHPKGSVLGQFEPQNPLENCLAKLLMSSLRRTQDPALRLRLLELWAVPDPAVAMTYWRGVSRLAALFQPRAMPMPDAILVAKLKLLDSAQQLHLVKNLLMRTDPWQILSLIERRAFDEIDQLFQLAMTAAPISDAPAAFF